MAYYSDTLTQRVSTFVSLVFGAQRWRQWAWDWMIETFDLVMYFEVYRDLFPRTFNVYEKMDGS